MPRFGAYELVRHLGRGGMAHVFEARHTELGKSVAVKILHSPIVGLAAVRRVLREGRAAAAVRHPNVVEVIDVGVQDGTPYLVMELLEGEDLAVHLERTGPLAPRQVADLLLPVISGVAAAHAADVIHRDLKPRNIFLARRHRSIEPVVVDFGISKIVGQDPSATSSGVGAGTVEYMSPEQVRGSRELTPQSDQYALGIILYECATGDTPFADEDRYELLHAIMTADVVPPSELNPTIVPAFDTVVLRAIARDPDERFPNVRALGSALLPFAGEEARRRWAIEFGAPSAESPWMAVGAPATLRSRLLDWGALRPTRAPPLPTAAALVAMATIGFATVCSREPPNAGRQADVVGAASAVSSGNEVAEPPTPSLPLVGAHSSPDVGPSIPAPSVPLPGVPPLGLQPATVPAPSAQALSRRVATPPSARNALVPIARPAASQAAHLGGTPSTVERGTANIPIVE
jgi:serine/threonine-protein kinase